MGADWLSDESKALPGAQHPMEGTDSGSKETGPGGLQGAGRLRSRTTREVRRTRQLHRRAHAVEGVVDLVFVGVQSFSSVPVVP